MSSNIVQDHSSPKPSNPIILEKYKSFQDNTEEQDRSTGKEESRFDGKSARGERSTEDLYKRKILEKRTLEESSSRGEIFCGKKSKVTIEDVSSEEPRNEEEGSFQVEPIIEEEEEEKLPKSPQRKESVVIEELLDDISEGKEKIEEKENGSNYRWEEERERVHTEADTALRDVRERDFPKLPQRKESVIIEELSDDISEEEERNDDKIIKEAELNKETVDIVPKPLLSGTKLDTSVSRQGKASNNERRNVQMMEESPEVELSDEANGDNATEEEEVQVNEDRMDKVNVVAVESSVDEIGLIDSVRVFGNQSMAGDPEDQEGLSWDEGTKLAVVERDEGKDNTTPSTRENFVREELLSRNLSKEYFGSPEREVIHTEADIALRNIIERLDKKGEVAEEGLLVERRKLDTENVKSHEMLDEALVVRKILKEYGEEEEDSEHVLLGFEHQVGRD